MRTSLAVVGALASALGVFALAEPARAQSASVVGIARSATLMDMLQALCPAYFAVDENRVTELARRFREEGARAFGADAFRQAMTMEIPRRRAEISELGPRDWCVREKEAQIALGGAALFR